MNEATETYRREREAEYVSALLTGSASGNVDPAAMLQICPSRLLNHDLIGKHIVEAIETLVSKDKPVTVPAVATVMKQAKHDYHDITRYIDSLYGFESACLSLAKVCWSEGSKFVAKNEGSLALGDCDRIAADPEEIAQQLENVIKALRYRASDCLEDHSAAALSQAVIEDLMRGKLARPLPTPWDRLNAVLKGGICPGEMAVLAARPGMGKTAFAGCLSTEVARLGLPVLFISREVKDKTVMARIMAREARVDMRFFRQGIEHAPDIMPRLKQAQRSIAQLPLQIIERSIAPMTPAEVRRLAKGITGIGLVVVDYLQLMIPEIKNTNSREREIAEMSRAFKQLALDCDCPVLLLSQLSRAAEQNDGAPQLSHLRESGAIEQDADIVMFLHSRKDLLQNTVDPYVQVIVAKGRSSGTGAMWTRFNKAFCDFTEATEEPPRSAKSKNYDL